MDANQPIRRMVTIRLFSVKISAVSDNNPNRGQQQAIQRAAVAHREVGKHEILPPYGKTLQPPEEERDVVVVVRLDRHVLHALLGCLKERK